MLWESCWCSKRHADINNSRTRQHCRAVALKGRRQLTTRSGQNSRFSAGAGVPCSSELLCLCAGSFASSRGAPDAYVLPPASGAFLLISADKILAHARATNVGEAFSPFFQFRQLLCSKNNWMLLCPFGGRATSTVGRFGTSIVNNVLLARRWCRCTIR